MIQCVISSKRNVPHTNLTIVAGNVFDANNLLSHFEGQDAIVSTLGFPKCEGKVTTFTESMKEIPPIKIISCVFASCYLVDFEGNLWTFGYNSFGQLGNDHEDDLQTPK